MSFIVSTAGSGAGGLGYGQTWQNKTASRALDTLYTNSTGKPIQIIVAVDTSTPGGGPSLVINGILCVAWTTYGPATQTICKNALWGIVPIGATYKEQSPGSGIGCILLGWWELTS